MNKSELVSAIAEHADLTKVQAAAVVDAFTSTVTEALKNGDTVSLIGFGSFSVRERAAREARNPRTGEMIKLKASKAPVFKAGKAFKEAL
ncbi:HU family DNA-binding protein [Aquimonas sp.]|jgi:DNA-binding protein HU-beta|uniref:HU family DNA-binding protein n=1 Tax=Aquimonas sp. TaxID=1872588 RepID=UPI0037BE3897